MSCPVCSDQKSEQEWVLCEPCDRWFHFGCCGVPSDKIADLVEYHCKSCEAEHGPSIERHRSKRQRKKINYASLNEGIVEVDKTHAHVSRFRENYGQHPFPVVDGDSLPESLDTPVIVKKENYDTLGMFLLKDMNARYVRDVLGADTPLPVVDVVTQNILPGWTLGRWVDYLESTHRQTLNVISLEFSKTPLKGQMTRPRFVRENDLVDKVWPSGVPGKPEVGYYCLMGVEGSYTDFHVDFGGTSVYYHVLEGQKTFLFIPPTKHNMKMYEKWCKNPDQQAIWFPDTLRKKECYKVTLSAGDTMFLPSGWIHAVHTPKDSFVIGGNFLSKQFLEMHLEVADLEKRIETPAKFTFPDFLSTLWYAARWFKETGDVESFDRLKPYLEAHGGKPKGVDAEYLGISLPVKKDKSNHLGSSATGAIVGGPRPSPTASVKAEQ